jgi:hypothetical protein
MNAVRQRWNEVCAVMPTPATQGRATTALLTTAMLAVALGLSAAWSPSLALGISALLALSVLVLTWPVTAAYLLLAVTPLVAGMDRGALLPLVRPNEALALVLGALLLIRGAARLARGNAARPTIRPVDVALLAMALAGSVLPILWMLARGLEMTSDDVMHALTLWKYLGIYVLFRSTVQHERQVARCLWVAVGSAAIVAIVAIIQSLQLLGVPELLMTYYAPFGNEGAVDNARGTSTLASSIAVADLMAYALGITLAWLLRGAGRRGALIAISVVLSLGALGSGQFSGVIALLLAVVSVGWITGQLGRALRFAVPTAIVGALVLWPVIERRLSGFDSPDGMPHSWVGRLDNLRTFFWPELFSDLNFLLGVRPSSRIAATETWRDWVWIESGHTWLLWSGGLPLLFAFFAFVVVAVRETALQARQREDAFGVAGVAAFSALCVMAVLMLLDQHLTLRGSADLLFPLLALGSTERGRLTTLTPETRARAIGSPT